MYCSQKLININYSQTLLDTFPVVISNSPVIGSRSARLIDPVANWDTHYYESRRVITTLNAGRCYTADTNTSILSLWHPFYLRLDMKLHFWVLLHVHFAIRYPKKARSSALGFGVVGLPTRALDEKGRSFPLACYSRSPKRMVKKGAP